MMRTIRVSDSVWQAIAKRGNFGETEDDVLRRAFELPPSTANGEGTSGSVGRRRSGRGRRRNLATRSLSTYVQEGNLVVGFRGGPQRKWKLSSTDDKAALRRVRQEAVAFAEDGGATIGQINAVKKALTEAGYYLTK